jgi:hypothetical protein
MDHATGAILVNSFPTIPFPSLYLDSAWDANVRWASSFPGNAVHEGHTVLAGQRFSAVNGRSVGPLSWYNAWNCDMRSPNPVEKKEPDYAILDTSDCNRGPRGRHFSM